MPLLYDCSCEYVAPGHRPTDGISVEFEIRSKFEVLWFKLHSANNNEILHTSRQCTCRDACQISFDQLSMFLTLAHQILNLIEIPLVGRGLEPISQIVCELMIEICRQLCALILILMTQWSNNFAHAMSSYYCQISIKPERSSFSEVWWYIMSVNSYNDDSRQNELRSRVVLFQFIWKQSAYPGIASLFQITWHLKYVKSFLCLFQVPFIVFHWVYIDAILICVYR